MSASQRHVFVERDDVRIEVRVEGEGPAIVLLPSSLRDSLDLDPLARSLASHGYTVLRPQPRAMARSTGSIDRLSLTVLAADVAAVIERIAGAPAIVAGHAYGHYVARLVDLEHPAWVRGLVLIAAAERAPRPDLSGSIDVIADPAQPPEVRIAHLHRAFFAPGNDPAGWLTGWYPHLKDAYRRAANVPDRRTWWPRTNAPILDLQASEDPWRPPASRDELRHVLGERVTVQVIDRASHALPVERPAEVAAAIAQWSASLAGGR